MNWFGFKLGKVARRIGGSFVYVVLLQAFRRVMDDGTAQGVGLLQLGGRHLLYAGSSYGRPHVCLGFAWLTGSRP